MWYNVHATQTAYFSLIRENTLVKSVFSLFSYRIGESLCSNIRGEAFFRCIPSGVHLFICGWGGYMNKDISRKVIDVTGTELTPGEPTVCLGNGEQGFECCCDECDYYLLCFPEFDPKSKRNNKTKIPHTLLWQKQRKGTFDISISKAHLLTFREVKKASPV